METFLWIIRYIALTESQTLLWFVKTVFVKNTHRASYLYYDQEWNFVPLNKGDEKIQNPKIERPKNFEKNVRNSAYIIR